MANNGPGTRRRGGRTIGDVFVDGLEPKVLRDMRWLADLATGRQGLFKRYDDMFGLPQKVPRLQVGRNLTGLDNLAKAYAGPLGGLKVNEATRAAVMGAAGFKALDGVGNDFARWYSSGLAFDVLSTSAKRDLNRQCGKFMSLNDQAAGLMSQAVGLPTAAQSQALAATLEGPLKAARAQTEWSGFAVKFVGLNTEAKAQQAAMFKALVPSVADTLSTMQTTRWFRDSFPTEAFTVARTVLNDLTIEDIEDALAGVEDVEDEDTLAQTLWADVQEWFDGREFDADAVYVIAFAAALGALLTVVVLVPYLLTVWGMTSNRSVLSTAHLSASKVRAWYLGTEKPEN